MTAHVDPYRAFLEAKVRMAPALGFEISEAEINPLLKPHQRVIVRWAVRGGRRAIFCAFGLGKTFMQLETVRLALARLDAEAGRPHRALIVLAPGRSGGVSVYVDDVRHAFGRMVMCHMWADSLDELLAMADRIGVARRWIQGHPTLSFGKHRSASWVHFDISLGMKARAIAAGAVLTDRFGPLEFEARQDIASGDAARVDRGEGRLARVAAARGLRGPGAPIAPDLLSAAVHNGSGKGAS